MGDISVMGLPFNTIVILKSGTNWFESPLFSGLIGVLVGFALTGIKDHFKGKNELDQYEYFLLSRIKDILETNNIEIKNKKIDDLVDEIRSDLRSTKLESSKIAFDLLMKARKGEEYSEGMEIINTRLASLRKGGYFHRIRLKFNKIWKLFF